jgi:hypothetical protein
MRRFIIPLAISLFVFQTFIIAEAQEQTVGLFINEAGSFEGYTLFAPMQYSTTYLIDNNGLLVRSWDSDYNPGNSVYFLENGNLLRPGRLDNPVFPGGGSSGIIQEMDWDGVIVWEYQYSDNEHMSHHDVERLPDGNTLIIAWERKSAAQAIAAGRNPALISEGELWPDHIIEVHPDSLTGDSIVWEWHIWDHLIQEFDSTKANYGVVEDHPELMNINFAYRPIADWNHFNSIDYNPELDQILISANGPSEILVIDHSTTTAEAAGHTGGIYGRGGDFLYRWGNPRAYGAGSESDRQFFKQHDANWIKPGYPGAGNILVFNNGQNRPGGNYSSVEEIIPPIDSTGNYILQPGSSYGPDQPHWIYTADNPPDLYSPRISGAQRLPNGNTLICDGVNGVIFEVMPPDDSIVWLYVNPVTRNGPMVQGDPIPIWQNSVFRATRFSPDYPGFIGKDLTPGDPIEIYPNSVDDSRLPKPSSFTLRQNYPNPFNQNTIITYYLPDNKIQPARVQLLIYDLLGRLVRELINETQQPGEHTVTWKGTDNSGADLPSGVYFYRLHILSTEISEYRKLVLMK